MLTEYRHLKEVSSYINIWRKKTGSGPGPVPVYFMCAVPASTGISQSRDRPCLILDDQGTSSQLEHLGIALVFADSL